MPIGRPDEPRDARPESDLVARVVAWVVLSAGIAFAFSSALTPCADFAASSDYYKKVASERLPWGAASARSAVLALVAYLYLIRNDGPDVERKRMWGMGCFVLFLSILALFFSAYL